MTYEANLTDRTLTGTAKGDGINWRQYGLLWSGRQGCWVWARTTTPDRIRQAVWQLERNFPGITITGDAEPVEIDLDERDRRLIETHEHRADRAGTEAAARFAAVDKTLDMIPLGQPILVGHHSEGRHRRDLARMDTNMGKGVEATKTAEHEARLADEARHRLDSRARHAVEEPVPAELLQVGMDVEWVGPGGQRRRRFTVAKVNRTTVKWASHGCSGTRPIDRLFRAWDTDGDQVWPERGDVE